MSDTIIRPTFYEGEILPASDLIAAVDSPRSQLARHERYLHRWGIAFGLKLEGLPNNTKPTSVVVRKGVAVDGSGREVVVPADVTLNPGDFASFINAQKDLWYPVFLTGRDEQATGSSMLTGACGTSQPNQIKETYDIQFRPPGADQTLDEQNVPDVMDGPADGVSADPWLILLGYVQFDPTQGNFIAVADFDPNSPARRRYVGVNAASVVSGSGAVQFATHPAGAPDAITIMALEVHEANKGEMVFGKQGADGNVVPVMTVSAAGDLTITGKFSSAVKPGTVQVQSGTASDGVILPLPPGITSANQADVHVQVSLHFTSYPLPPSANAGDIWIWTPLECSVDDSRLVSCRIQWTRILPAPAVTDVHEAAAMCGYTILATAASTGG